MNEPTPVIPDRAAAVANDPALAERLLTAVHPVCSHDLPNQMVSLHSLLNLLDMEEVDRLGEEGREYLHRLQNVAGKMATLIDFLKESVRLARLVPKRERIELAGLLEELRIETRSFLDGTPDWATSLEADAVTSDEAALSQSLLEILRGSAGSSQTLTVHWESRKIGDEVTLQLAAEGAAAPSLAAEPWLVLARERLARLGVVVTTQVSGDGSRFSLRFPTEET
jgi:light-regulated signal transduction histidine kinase (bacteriophytochrome)